MIRGEDKAAALRDVLQPVDLKPMAEPEEDPEGQFGKVIEPIHHVPEAFLRVPSTR